MSGTFHQPGSQLLALQDGQLLSIFSYLVDLQLETLCSFPPVLEDVLEEEEEEEDEENFKSAYPESYAQILKEKKMRRTITRPARELKAYSLICKRFHEVIANSAHEVFLYSGLVTCFKTQYIFHECGIDIDDENGGRCEIFDELFNGKNLEMLQSSAPGAGFPLRIRVDNKNQDRGFWYGQTKEDLEKGCEKSSGSWWFNHKRAAEGVSYSSHSVSDKDRAAFLRALRAGERNVSYREEKMLEKYVADPRFDFFILGLEGTPKPPIMQYLELTDWVDSKLVQLRSVLIDPALPSPSDSLPARFDHCMEWCFEKAVRLDEEGVEYIEPDMDRVLDSIVSWAVTDFERGCQHYIAHDVLFGTGSRNEKGWDNWTLCNGSSEYFVPYMIMQVDSEHWP